MNSDVRRRFLKRQFLKRQFLKRSSAAVVTSVIFPILSYAGDVAYQLTPSQSEGPFYPVSDQADKDTDLTQIKGRSTSAIGERVRISGRVTNQRGDVIDNVQVEIWQANSVGRYQHLRDPNKAAVDPNFQGWGISRSSSQGHYQFTTILPGAYPASADWIRPPHIHFKVYKSGYQTLITQMYFPEQGLNKSDLILNSLSSRQMPLLIAKKATATKMSEGVDSSVPVFKFNIVLRSIS